MLEMTEVKNPPEKYQALLKKTTEIGFPMASDSLIGPLLKALTASKPGGRFLDIGTGTGLSLSWIIAGMDDQSEVISIESEPDLSTIAGNFLGDDRRVEILCEDGFNWLQNYSGKGFDLIFADAWPGKFCLLEETLELLNLGGFYLIDDLNPRPNWPEGHHEKVTGLITRLEQAQNITINKMNWSTGLILATKTNHLTVN